MNRSAVLLALMAFATTLAAHTARAGQAQAKFSAVLRIDPRLVEQDRAAAAKSLAPTIARGASTAANRLATTYARSALPRAGGGVCVRQFDGEGHFRWVCD